MSRLAEAEQWFRRAQRLAPDDPSVYHHYGKYFIKYLHCKHYLHCATFIENSLAQCCHTEYNIFNEFIPIFESYKTRSVPLRKPKEHQEDNNIVQASIGMKTPNANIHMQDDGRQFEIKE